MNICILGAGAWGTALAIHLDRVGHTVTLVTRRMEHALAMATEHENKDYLPGFKLNESMQIGCEIRPGLMEADIVILACPSIGLRDWCKKIKEVLDSSWRLKMAITLCKGLERDSLKVPSKIVEEELPMFAGGVISGPNFAHEVAMGKPAATVLASENAEDWLLEEVQEALSSEAFRVYRSHDVLGVELGGCLKNIYAIGIGCCQGLKLGDNAQAALITRAVHEMVRVGVKLGGKRETFYGLSGFGDFVLTCTGQASRNRTFGYELGKGGRVEDLMSHRKTVVEGYWATECFMRVCCQNKIEVPIMEEIYKILYEKKAPIVSLQSLMSRSLKHESV